jgi:hypothetical protein
MPGMNELEKIEPPSPSPRRELARRVAEALASSIPGGPLLAAVFAVTHPDKLELVRREWESAVTRQLNVIMERLEPTIKLSDAAIDLAVGLSSLSDKGRPETFKFASIKRQLPNMEAGQIHAAMGELELCGLVNVRRLLGGRAIYTPTNNLYWVFDPLAFEGRSPRDDAKALAEVLVRDGALPSSAIALKLGWAARRFNPAMSLLLEVLSNIQGVIRSGEADPDFVASEVRVDDTGKAALRREFRLAS